MEIALYAKKAWERLYMPDIFGQKHKILDQLQNYISTGQYYQGSVFISDEFEEIVENAMVSSLPASISTRSLVGDIDGRYFDRRIRVTADKLFVNLDKSYFVGEHFYNATDINIVVEKDGKIFVLYEDGDLVEVGQVELDSPFRDSRFHASMIDRDNDMFICIHDVFFYRGLILSDMDFEDRLEILKTVDFCGEYEYCQICTKNWYYLTGESLAKVVDFGTEFVLPSNLISSYRGSVAICDELKQVVFSSKGNIFAVEWNEVTAMDDTSSLVKMIKRVKKQKYPILQYVFNPRKSRYSFSMVVNRDNPEIHMKFSDLYPPIIRYSLQYKNVSELIHSILVELVCSYVIIEGEIKELRCSLSEKFLIIDNYFKNIRSSLEFLTIRRLNGIVSQDYDCKFLLISLYGDDFKVIQRLSRVRLKHIKTRQSSDLIRAKDPDDP